jgi:hypothetical protein
LSGEQAIQAKHEERCNNYCRDRDYACGEVDFVPVFAGWFAMLEFSLVLFFSESARAWHVRINIAFLFKHFKFSPSKAVVLKFAGRGRKTSAEVAMSPMRIVVSNPPARATQTR